MDTLERHRALEAARKEYQRLAAENGGRASAQELVDVAADPANPAHPAFEWDNEIAGNQWRVEQARRIIRSIRVVADIRSPISVIAFVRDPEAKDEAQGYVATTVLRVDHDLSRRALVDEVRRAVAAMERAREVAVALGLEGEVDSILDALTGFAARVRAA